MHGNVLEWCQDWYGDYCGGSIIDPQGAVAGSYRVLRGGNWIGGGAGGCRSANRAINGVAGAAGGDVGFRVVLVPRAAVPGDMVFIQPGTFTMGSPTTEVDRNPDEGPQTTVTLSRGFWMGKCEVTQREYLAVVGSNPSQFSGDLSRPVETVSWHDATNYCGLLTQRDRAAGLIPKDFEYRLPTEAEWEYACRAGTTTRYSHGEDLGYTNVANYAWYLSNSGGATHRVGQKLPNRWGLYDMHGNVWEWCQDWYGSYNGNSAVDPQGPATGSNRVARGGSWVSGNSNCRSARRLFYEPWQWENKLGFRVVLVHEP